ncbi:MAG: alanine--glyoxylate aminotransferase family protein, partial [Verrucomicrobia bacterium]|nr:alanine--glyoxylate aminotransferase family protein [Verrucomicrobiota bacterium]
MTNSIKLFIPGPVQVSEKTFAAMTLPMIGHRGSEFKALYRDVYPRLQQLFGTAQPVFISTSSAWGIMEGAIRDLVRRKVLNCMCGAFSDKWFDVAKRCGKSAGTVQVEWGQPIDPVAVDRELSTGQYDALTLIHNETSTGLLNPLREISEVVEKYPDVVFIVDTVSSFSALPIPMDELGIDIMLAGSQKALALPPGLSLFAASERAFERASQITDRGYYFDILEFKKNAEDYMTPSTPSIPHIYALRSKLDDIFEEGLERRYQRHLDTNRLVHNWVVAKGFEFFAKEGFRSVTLTCVKNNRELDIPAFTKQLRDNHGFQIDGG